MHRRANITDLHLWSVLRAGLGVDWGLEIPVS